MSVSSPWEDLVCGNRRALARAISLCESTREDHRRAAEQLVARASEDPRSEAVVRIGITGPAGVGKSTLIDVLGAHLIDAGLRPAVLAIDPSSRRTGGSLLGDQTRMSRLLQRGAFVRPSPTRGHLGGTGAHTLEAALLCAAAGFDPILIETVGVGQNETQVSDVVDLVLLLLQPGAGDELQGMKRGLLEHADRIAVAQADGERAKLAEQTRSRFESALRILRGADTPPVLLVSALEGRGISELWQSMRTELQESQASGVWEERRRAQRVRWFRSGLLAEMLRLLESDVGQRQRLVDLELAVSEGRRTVPDALRAALEGLVVRSD